MSCRRVALALITTIGAAYFPGRVQGATAPSAPSSLSASNVTSSGVTLCWTASTGSVAGYSIYAGQTLAGTTAGTCATISNLLPATAYTFTVKAVDATGTSSAASSAVVVTTLASQDVSAPSAPSNFAWTVDDGTVTMTWTASTDDVGVVAYDLYYGNFYLGAFAETRVDVTGFKAGVQYVFSVKARDAAGNVSVASNTITVLLGTGADTTPPTTPFNLTASSVTASSARLRWSPSTDNVGVVMYLVYSGDTVMATAFGGTAVNVSGLVPSTTYSFTVKAMDAASNVSAASAPVSVTTLAPPDTTPPVLTVTAPVDGATITTRSVVVTGQAKSQQLGQVTVQGVAVSVAEDGTFQTVVGVGAGDNAIVVTAADLQGSQASTTMHVTRTADTTVELFFTDWDNVHVDTLWVSDGTAAGTGLLTQVASGQYGPPGLYELLVLDGKVLFQSMGNGSSSLIWKTDGTSVGTAPLTEAAAEVEACNYSYVGWPFGNRSWTAAVLDGVAYFGAHSSGSSGCEPWRTDGTVSGTYRLTDIVDEGDPAAGDFVALNGVVYFWADTASSENQLWKTDGTAGGTVPVVNTGWTAADTSHQKIMNGAIYVAAMTTPVHCEVWRTDGTARGTTQVTNLDNQSATKCPELLAVLNGKLYFSVKDGTSTALWSTDGTSAGTVKVSTVYVLEEAVVSGNALYFVGYNNNYGAELWRIDGTSSGPTLVADITPESDTLSPHYLTPFGGELYFTAGPDEREVWKTDGTPDGTVRVWDRGPSNAFDLEAFAVANDALYFVAKDETGYCELWKSDGTPEGTTSVTDACPTKIITF